jgi:hypothetical protein
MGVRVLPYLGEQEQGVVGCLMRGIMDALPISNTSADVKSVPKMHGFTKRSTGVQA